MYKGLSASDLADEHELLTAQLAALSECISAAVGEVPDTTIKLALAVQLEKLDTLEKLSAEINRKKTAVPLVFTRDTLTIHPA